MAVDGKHAISVLAAEVLGSPMEAEDWLRRPELDLDGQRPIDLLGTAEGRRLLHEHLMRLECGRGMLMGRMGLIGMEGSPGLLG
jgi:uncharacterized protein (DUF2384 family)